jgi:nitrite reductase/ring-hydroxylating ferredoxin subunit
MKSRKMKRRIVRVPGAALLEDGHARKVLVPVEGGPPLEIVLVRRSGILFALDSLCPHEGGRLAEGPLWEGRYVYCPLHLYRFDPRTGEPIEVECDRARVYPVREIEGAAEIEILDERP